jgi:hypothetical protein
MDQPRGSSPVVPTPPTTEVADSEASDGLLVSLAAPGQSAEITDLQAASKLAIRYASVSVGTSSVGVNDEPPRRVNVHSSDALSAERQVEGPHPERHDAQGSGGEAHALGGREGDHGRAVDVQVLHGCLQSTELALASVR